MPIPQYKPSKNHREIKMLHLKNKQAFTLVELIVVVVILAILATISFVSYISYTSDAKKSVVKTNFSELSKVLDLYYTKNGKYPDTDNGKFGSTAISQIREITNAPQDPFSKTEYTYTIGADGTSYTLQSVFDDGEVYKVYGKAGKSAVLSAVLNCNVTNPTDVTFFTVVDGVITAYDWTNGPKDVIIPCEKEGIEITSIGEGAFYASETTTSIIIPSSIKTIGNYAFYGSVLKDIVIPNSVISIGNNAFATTQITNLSIPNSIKTIGNYAFYDTALKDVVIPDSVISIGNNAFQGTQLTNIIIPDSITYIGEDTFLNSKLSSVTIPNNITTIGIGAFLGNHLTTVSIPDSVMNIYSDAFQNNGPNQDSNSINCSGTECQGTWNLIGGDWVKQ